MTPLWPALWLSLRIAFIATLLTVLIGVPLAMVMSRRTFSGKGLIEGLIMMPLVLPPTVVGYCIIMLLGARGLLGQWFHEWFDYSMIFRIEGAVLAAAIVALPMLYIPAKAAFASVDHDLEDLARCLGASRFQLFWHVSIPLARRGLVSGILLAFARSLGEFGATIMVFGWQPNRITLPISIYADFEQNQLDHAGGAVIALSILSLALVMAYNSSSTSRP
ncbi:MAG TPA: molybdate ABC transporter permease subunit [Tepidisphaeraceae bacterium]|nr:molybdate ABC transporter permease subunit [Tepidisphaeraceae bacterium]